MNRRYGRVDKPKVWSSRSIEGMEVDQSTATQNRVESNKNIKIQFRGESMEKYSSLVKLSKWQITRATPNVYVVNMYVLGFPILDTT